MHSKIQFHIHQKNIAICSLSALLVIGGYFTLKLNSSKDGSTAQTSDGETHTVLAAPTTELEQISGSALSEDSAENRVIGENSEKQDFSKEAFAKLTPRERAYKFLEFIRTDLEGASDLLASSEEWLEYEREGLSAVLFEEVVREKSTADIADWLHRLSENGEEDESFGFAEFLLRGALNTPDLIKESGAFLETLAKDPRKQVADVAQAESLLLAFENEGFAAAVKKGSEFGIESKPDDAKFEILIGRALQEDPQKVLTWLKEEVPGTPVADFYLPFALSQWSWQDYEGATSVKDSLQKSPPRGLGSGI